MLRQAATYLALSVLYAGSNLVTASDSYANVNDQIINPHTVEKSIESQPRSLSAISPFWSPIGKVIEGGKEGDNFGFATDISADGKFVAIGAGDYSEENGKRYVGQVQVFARRFYQTFYKWEQVGPNITGVEEREELGNTLKLSRDGKIVAVGSVGADERTGHVKVYAWKLKAQEWVQLGSTIKGFAIGDEAGWGFDLSSDGRTIAFGVPKSDQYGYDNGMTVVYYYDRATQDWEEKGNPIPGFHSWSWNNTGTEAFFGWDVAINGNGNTVMMSGPFDKDQYYNSTGAVKVFDYDEEKGDWEQRGDTRYGTDAYDEFGTSIAMSKDGLTMAVGAGCYYYCGYDEETDTHEDLYRDYVRVYRWMTRGNGKRWVFIGGMPRKEGDIGFGSSITLSDSGDRIGFATAGEDYGYARVFQYNMETSEWSKIGQDLVIEGHKDGQNGRVVTLSGDGENLIVGSSDANEKTGSVKVYNLASDAATSPVGGCEDSIGWMEWQGRKKMNYRTCKFIKARKEDRCLKPGFASMCPQTCGTCFQSACEDGPLPWRINGKMQSCETVKSKPKMMCNFPIARTTCHKTCQTAMYDTLCTNKE